MDKYEYTSKVLKALSEPRRLKIIDILSCCERCACEILEHFDFTQPTLSHHMKILEEAGLVNVRKDGIWNYYSLNMKKWEEISRILQDLFQPSEDCICHVIDRSRNNG